MRPYHPDDSNMRWLGQGRGPQGNGMGGGGGQGILSPFLPGDKGLLAKQLSMGFGGGDPQAYRQRLAAMYQPTFIPGVTGGMGGGNGGGNVGDVTSGGQTMPNFKSQRDVYEWIRRYGTPTDPGTGGYGSYLGGGSR